MYEFECTLSLYKWGPHKFLGILSMLRVSEVWKNKLYSSFTQVSWVLWPVQGLSWVWLPRIVVLKLNSSLGKNSCTQLCPWGRDPWGTRNIVLWVVRIPSHSTLCLIGSPLEQGCSLIFCIGCLLWIDKERVKEKTYIWVSVWWKTKH